MIVLTILATVLVTIVANSFFEWSVHGLLMHRGWGGKYLRKTHHEHHEDYPLGSYKNRRHGLHVHLPWWSGVLTLKIMTAFGLFVSYLTGMWTIVWCVGVTSVFYFVAYNYFHTCFHVPDNRWFEKTKLYWFLDRYHHIHHTRDGEWERLSNICLVCPLADWVMGTWLRPKKRTTTATTR